MPLPFVSRQAHDEMRAVYVAQLGTLQDRYDALLEKYHGLKVQGAVSRAPVVAAKAPPPSPEERVLAESRMMYEENVVAELVGQGHTPADARRTALFLRNAVEDLSPVLPNG